MKLKITKSSIFILLVAFSAGSTSHLALAENAAIAQRAQITAEQAAVIHKLHTSIRHITDIALYLIDSLKDPAIPYKLDEIVIRIESIIPLINETIECIQVELSAERCNSDQAAYETYKRALTLKLDMITEVQDVVTKIAQILRDGLEHSSTSNKISPIAIKFWNQIKDPLKKLCTPEEFNRIETKLHDLHSAIEGINEENASLIKELLALLGKLRQLTGGPGDLQGYSSISKRLPKGRAAFQGIPAQLSINDWIHEMRSH